MFTQLLVIVIFEKKNGLQYWVALYKGHSVVSRVKRDLGSTFEVSWEEADKLSFSATEIEPVVEGIAVPCESSHQLLRCKIHAGRLISDYTNVSNYRLYKVAQK